MTKLSGLRGEEEDDQVAAPTSSDPANLGSTT